MFRALAIVIRTNDQGVNNAISALDQITEIQTSILFPYLRPTDRDQAANEMADLWKQTFGDPNDPAVQAEIAKMVAYLDGST